MYRLWKVRERGLYLCSDGEAFMHTGCGPPGAAALKSATLLSLLTIIPINSRVPQLSISKIVKSNFSLSLGPSEKGTDVA